MPINKNIANTIKKWMIIEFQFKKNENISKKYSYDNYFDKFS